MARRVRTSTKGGGSSINPVRIEVEPFGDKQVSREMLRIGKRAMNLKPLWPLLAKYFYAIEQAQFESEGSRGSGGWPALKEATLKRKLAKGQDPGILRAENVLANSLTKPNARYSKRTMRRGEFFAGSVDPKGVHHQFGAPAAGVPMRKPVEFKETDKVAWVKMIQRFIITKKMPSIPSV